ncbi:MAG TPA: PRC-barrel domain-containing protein [Chthoniobacterales bacterium]|nr:PRC-barrel domain-containing protein [Chthoniobacterales bacterium]
MKTSLIVGAALVNLGLAAAPLIAQTQTTTSSTSTGYVQTSKIIGTKVKTSQGEEVGVVKDVVLDRGNGCMAYTVLSTGSVGTRVTGGGKLVAVPWGVYTTSPDTGYLTVSVERDRIYNAPVFEYSRISDTAYMTNVYSHFGVSAGVGVSSATSTGARTMGAAATTTGATGQTQTGGYPSPAASPRTTATASPAMSASPNASVSASPSASASGTVPPDAKSTASPKSESKSRNRSGTSAVSARHKGDEAMRGNSGESTSEASSGKKSSARKSTDEESSAESADASPSKKSSHKKSSKEGTSETAPTPNGEQE